MYQNIPTKVLTGEVRLSYEHLTRPYANKPGDDEKYSVTLLIPKTDNATYQNILASIEAAVDATGKLWGGVRPPVLPQPLHDGDGVRDNGTPYGPECKGCWVMIASTKNKPQVVHQSDINTQLAPQDIYGGMWARVTINFFGYNSNGKKGVGCGLGNVMKTRDDEPFGGGAPAAVDFDGIGSTVAYADNPTAPAYPYPAQPNYAAPAPQAAVSPGAPAVGAINPLTGQPY